MYKNGRCRDPGCYSARSVMVVFISTPLTSSFLFCASSSSLIAHSLGTAGQDSLGLGDDGYGTKALSKFPGMVTTTFKPCPLFPQPHRFCFCFFQILSISFVCFPKAPAPRLPACTNKNFFLCCPLVNAESICAVHA